MTARAIVVDANILVRAVLGSRVPELLAAHAEQVTFLSPDIAFDDAREHLPTVLAKRGKSAMVIQAALKKLETLAHVIVPVPAESYLPFKDRALARIGSRPARRLMASTPSGRGATGSGAASAGNLSKKRAAEPYRNQ